MIKQDSKSVVTFSLCDIFGAVTRIKADVMSGPIRKLIGPAKTRLQCYVEEASSLLSSGVEEKILEDVEIRVEEVIACINIRKYFPSRAF